MLEIFRSGTHSKALTPAVLARTAAVYDPAKHEAPIVIGHPKNNAPAYGWVAGLSFDEKNNSLSAEPEQIAPTLAEDVKAGRYKKISASRPESGSFKEWIPAAAGMTGKEATPAVSAKDLSLD